MSKQRRVAIVGLGMAVTPHAQSLLDLSGRVEVAWAYSPTEARRQSFAARFPFPVTGDFAAITGDPTIDTVLVLTPPNTHLSIVRELAAAGKHVLLEKPLEGSLDRAEALVEVCARAGVSLAVVFQHRFRPASLALAARLAAGELGPLANAAVSVRWWRPQTYYDEPGRGTLARDGGGVLLTQAIHTLDLFLSLTPPLAEVTAFAGTSALHVMETEDSVAAALRFDGGALGALDATTAAYPGFPERIDLVGSKATAVLTPGKLDLHHHDGRRETIGEEAAGGGGADPMAFTHDAHRGVLVEFLDALDAGRAPINSGRVALRVHYLIDALLESSRRRAPVTVRR
ncbi:MAG: Gfo/Idh/MocA family oxidoreductase [Betaproteobacteria bacterium]|nr:Gfo/Idh/MocA family oxidoreductase [Betaproteobacteria bacterium]